VAHSTERGLHDAAVAGQPRDEHALEPTAVQVVAESGAGVEIVLPERAVGVDLRAISLAEHEFRLVRLEVGMELGADASLHAVVVPDPLLTVSDVDGVPVACPGCALTKETWPTGCQSVTTMTWSKCSAVVLIGSMTASAPGIAMLPVVKST